MKVFESKPGLTWPEHIARVVASGEEYWRLVQRSDTMLAVREQRDEGDFGDVLLIATLHTWRRVADELDAWVIVNGMRDPAGREQTRAWCEVIRRGVLGEGGSGS